MSAQPAQVLCPLAAGGVQGDSLLLERRQRVADLPGGSLGPSCWALALLLWAAVRRGPRLPRSPLGKGERRTAVGVQERWGPQHRVGLRPDVGSGQTGARAGGDTGLGEWGQYWSPGLAGLAKDSLVQPDCRPPSHLVTLHATLGERDLLSFWGDGSLLKNILNNLLFWNADKLQRQDYTPVPSPSFPCYHASRRNFPSPFLQTPPGSPWAPGRHCTPASLLLQGSVQVPPLHLLSRLPSLPWSVTRSVFSLCVYRGFGSLEAGTRGAPPCGCLVLRSWLDWGVSVWKSHVTLAGK